MTKPIQCAMIIEDNEIDQRQFQRVLRKSDLVEEIVMFAYADEALEHLAANPDHGPDVIFLDVNMPRMNGFEFLDAAKVRLAVMLSKTVVAMLTTSLNPNDREQSDGYEEVEMFINKPLTPEEINDVIELVERKRRAA